MFVQGLGIVAVIHKRFQNNEKETCCCQNVPEITEMDDSLFHCSIAYIYIQGIYYDDLDIDSQLVVVHIAIDLFSSQIDRFSCQFGRFTWPYISQLTFVSIQHAYVSVLLMPCALIQFVILILMDQLLNPSLFMHFCSITFKLTLSLHLLNLSSFNSLFNISFSSFCMNPYHQNTHFNIGGRLSNELILIGILRQFMPILIQV